MGWLKEKYTKAYYLRRDRDGQRLVWGADGVEHWERGDIYPPAKRLLEAVDLEGTRVLDIGCGRGEAVRYCLARGAAFVCGIDFSEPAVEIARQTVADRRPGAYRLVCADALELLRAEQADRAYDVVLMLDVIEHIPRFEVDLLLPLVFRALSPGGTLIVQTPMYPENDDVMVTGGKLTCRDSSDLFEETKGMHVNRYSFEGLDAHLADHGFLRLWNTTFVRPLGT